ncbi:hypothetical protein [Actinomycetospora termitidis]|uniref:Integral membrane protein n=1 Tax=Actinomycetospora termitidis TaxID=3053470 RepID=A0ABT7MHG8_9PSEU|nr:hypothetical protein [Actinomycetospora sp. Odt1-22]MDL5160133.1 hypothetical protein [Actinomycetospora sp. Odt1-22]
MGVVAGVLVALDAAGTLLGPVRAVTTVVFMILGPGWAIAGFLRRSAPALVWAVAVAVGCAVGGLGAQAMLAAGWWHPDAALVLLVLLCVPALVWHVVRRR